MITRLHDWHLVPATDTDVMRWSFGRVSATSDLYKPAIFGAQQSLRCECGQYIGEESVGRTCSNCGVTVVRDAVRTRLQRLGHVELALCHHHPFDSEQILEVFPIAPIGFRQSADHSTNALGRKYEALLEENQMQAAKLPPPGSMEYYQAKCERKSELMDEIIKDIIGLPPTAGGGASDDLLSMLLNAMVGLNMNVAPLARSCAMAMCIYARL